MLDFKMYFLFVLIVFLGIVLGGKCFAMTNLYRVVNVEKDNLIEINNGKKFYLDGVRLKSNFIGQAQEYIRDVTKNSKVIIEPTASLINNVPCAIVYIWGNEELNNEDVDGLKKGFSNVKINFWNVKKGMGINLNELLVLKGFAEKVGDR